jgi:CheY-like chemotaxis protein
MNGYELGTALTARPEFAKVLMAAVTAYADPDSIEKSKEVGFAKHFTKPVDLAALHRLLDGRREELTRERH